MLNAVDNLKNSVLNSKRIEIDMDFTPPDLDIDLKVDIDINLQTFSRDDKLKSIKKTTKIKSDNGIYWYNTETNVYHNKSCKYYEKTRKGIHTTEPVGNECKICRIKLF